MNHTPENKVEPIDIEKLRQRFPELAGTNMLYQIVLEFEKKFNELLHSLQLVVEEIEEEDCAKTGFCKKHLTTHKFSSTNFLGILGEGERVKDLPAYSSPQESKPHLCGKYCNQFPGCPKYQKPSPQVSGGGGGNGIIEELEDFETVREKQTLLKENFIPKEIKRKEIEVSVESVGSGSAQIKISGKPVSVKSEEFDDLLYKYAYEECDENGNKEDAEKAKQKIKAWLSSQLQAQREGYMEKVKKIKKLYTNVSKINGVEIMRIVDIVLAILSE